MKHYITIIAIALMTVFSAQAQKLGLKTNLVYDATQTANLGLEIALGKKTTLDLSGNYNGWYTNEELNEKIRHYLFQPEFRYYFCENFNGHFLGVHALATEYNINGYNWLLNSLQKASSLRNVTQDPSRYEGVGFGAGIAYGYNLILSNRINLEFTIGAGYIHFDYDRYGSDRCDPYIESATKEYFGITKIGVSFIVLIK